MKAKFRFWITIICCIGIGFPLILFNLFWSSNDVNEGNPYMNRVQMRRLGKQPFAWNEKKVGDGNHTSEGLRNHNEIDPENNKADKNVTSNNDSEVNTCRNSVQGRVLIADDQGYICKRENVKGNGCCKVNVGENIETQRYSCEKCHNASGCCSVYENCISCCMHPLNRRELMNVLKEANIQSNILLLSVSDHFELCLAKCRTNSRSVQHENLYINPTQKYCFKRSPPISTSPTLDKGGET